MLDATCGALAETSLGGPPSVACVGVGIQCTFSRIVAAGHGGSSAHRQLPRLGLICVNAMSDACQGTVEVHAPSQEAAIDQAGTEFAELKQVTAWWLRSDYAKAELLPVSQRVIRRHQLLPMHDR